MRESPHPVYPRFAGAVIESIRISDSTFDGITEPDVLQHAGAITLRNVNVNPAQLVHSMNSDPAPR